MKEMIPYGRQNISQSDIDEVVDVLSSDFLTQGPRVPIFEKAVSDYCEINYAIAVNSATSALHISCLALGVGEGDIVWTSANTFVASSNSALYCGAEIDFIDIDEHTYNMCIQDLEIKLIEASKKNRLPKVVIPVHMSGQSCDMESIHRLSLEYNFKIIEDASHAIGGRYKDKKVGSCEYSSFTVFSFHPVKIITSGEGGMALTNDKDLAHKARLYSSHGITSEKQYMHKRPKEEIWNYQQFELGFNYRLTDIQAALGTNQLKRIDNFVNKRRKLALRYEAFINQEEIILPFQHEDSYSSYHLYLIKIKEAHKKDIQKSMFEYLTKEGIAVNLHYIPVYRQPYYEALGFKKGYCPNAEDYFKSILSIPMFPDLSFSDQDKVISIINSYFSP